MITTLEHYNQVYNHQIVQRNLGHLTPVKAMKRWYREKPEIFKKRVYDQADLDIFGWASDQVFPYKKYEGKLFKGVRIYIGEAGTVVGLIFILVGFLIVGKTMLFPK